MATEAAVTIREQAFECIRRFHVLSDVDKSGEDEVGKSSASNEANTADQLARFRLWAANIGVFAEGHGSLDWRLRESPSFKEVVVEFLESLQHTLHRGKDPKANKIRG